MPDFWGTTSHDLKYHKLRLELAGKRLLPLARQGEQGAIRSLLRVASEALKQGSPLPLNIGTFISLAIEDIANGVSLLKPFGLKRRRGERAALASIRARAFTRAYRVECFRAQGRSLEDSIFEVSEQDSASENTVKRDWKLNHRMAKREIDLQRKYLGNVISITQP